MLLTRRTIAAPALGAALAEHGILHSRYRVILQVREGVVEDPAIFKPVFRRRLNLDRSALIIPLHGKMRLVGPEGGVDLIPGQVASERRERRWTLRKEPDSAVLMIEWEPGHLGTLLLEPSGPAALAPASILRLRDACRPIFRGDASEGESAVAVGEILAILRAEGFPFDPVDEGSLVEQVPDWTTALTRAVDTAISSLSHQPMLVDLERALGWSERQIQRRIKEVHRRYASMVEGGWRELHHGWRFVVGASLMSARGATTEKVADCLGYSSPRAFCDSFANANLPSPGAVREILLKG